MQKQSKCIQTQQSTSTKPVKIPDLRIPDLIHICMFLDRTADRKDSENYQNNIHI